MADGAYGDAEPKPERLAFLLVMAPLVRQPPRLKMVGGYSGQAESDSGIRLRNKRTLAQVGHVALCEYGGSATVKPRVAATRRAPYMPRLRSLPALA